MGILENWERYKRKLTRKTKIKAQDIRQVCVKCTADFSRTLYDSDLCAICDAKNGNKPKWTGVKKEELNAR